MKLKQARTKAGMTQREVAERTHIPLGTLRRWEQGKNEPDTDTIIMLADLYGVSTDEILGSGFSPEMAYTLSPDERHLVDLYRACDARGCAAILRTAEGEAGVEAQREDGRDSGAVSA